MSDVLVNSHRFASFSPADLSGLALWLRSDSPLYQDSGRTTPATADGDPVGSWTDSGGSSRHAAQSTAGHRFTLKTGGNGINGHSVLRSDGAASNRLLTATFSLTQPFTALYAIRQVVDPAVNAGIYDGTTAYAAFSFYAGATNNRSFYAGATVTAQAVTVNTPLIAVDVVNGASSAFRKDGGTAVTGNPGAAAPGGIVLGGAGGGGNEWSSTDYAEMIVCTGVMSLTDINRAGAYLAARYGTTWSTAT